MDKTLFDEKLIGEAREKAKEIGNKVKDYTVDVFKAMIQKKSPREAQKALQKLVGERVKVPEIKGIFWAGDGTYIDFGTMWFELRASGTDAVLRFYIEGKDKAFLDSLNRAFVSIADKKIKEISGA